jgi:hypothetical protein
MRRTKEYKLDLYLAGNQLVVITEKTVVGYT